MNSEQKPGDPADKITDAKADGAFGGVSHRAGYGDDKLMRLIDFLRCHPRATLASGEGAILLAEIDRLTAQRSLPAVFIDQLAQREGELAALERENAQLRAAAKDSMDHYADARAEIDRLNAQWERLTSDEVVRVAINAWFKDTSPFPARAIINAARDAARGEG